MVVFKFKGAKHALCYLCPEGLLQLVTGRSKLQQPRDLNLSSHFSGKGEPALPSKSSKL